MPTSTADQGLVIPAAGDAADLPAGLTTYTGGVEPRLIKQYVNEADRSARNAAPTQGQVSWLQNLKRYEYWNDTATAWWEMLPLVARKTAEAQTANANTTFFSDTHLLLPVRANAIYKLSGWWYWDSGTTGDIKFQWLGPAAFTMPAWTVIGIDTTVTSVTTGAMVSAVASSATNAQPRGGAGIGTFAAALVNGVVITAGTAGNLQLQWAQNASEAVNTRLKQHSWIQLDRIG